MLSLQGRDPGLTVPLISDNNGDIARSYQVYEDVKYHCNTVVVIIDKEGKFVETLRYINIDPWMIKDAVKPHLMNDQEKYEEAKNKYENAKLKYEKAKQEWEEAKEKYEEAKEKYEDA